MDKPLISVIVPVYKTEKYLPQCIESIINQTYPYLEIILVDDGSPDGCSVLCDKYANQDSRIMVLHKENGGQASARNLALDMCSGDYIAFVDSDDWLERNAYQDMVSFATESNLDVVYCVPNVIDNEIKKGTRYEYYPNKTILNQREIAAKTLKGEISAEPWLKMCHKKCWDGVRFPEGRIYEDVAIAYCPLVNASRPVGFLDKPIYNYRINKEGTTQSRKPIARYHFFLALRERYDYAKVFFPEVAEDARNLAGRFAMGVFLDYYCNNWNELKQFQPEIIDFLTQEKVSLINSSIMPFDQKIALKMYYYSKPIFILSYRLMLPIIKLRWNR